MDVQLNFLRYSPTINWFDYFLERKKFFKLLSQEPLDHLSTISLCDQFIEQALAGDRELKLTDRRPITEKDDIVYMRHKIDDLWLCALSCFASCDWDLSLLLKNSTVVRVWALLNRLVRWMFESEKDQPKRQLLQEDPFKYICTFASINRSNFFIGWLYARWILLVDLNMRFPLPPARPTVSNPYFSVDQNLIQAEKLAQVAMEVRSRMAEAVNFLKQLVEDGSEKIVGSEKEVDVPTKQCFFPRLDVMEKGSPISALANFPKPAFSPGTISVSWRNCRLKILFDLVAAHFSAKHFQMSKHFLTKITSDRERSNYGLPFGNLLCIDENELRGYQKALGLLENTFEGKQQSETNPLLAFVKQKVDRSLVRLLSEGICRISLRQMANIRDNEEAILAMIEKFAAEMVALDGARKTSCIRQGARINGSICFLCALSPGFSGSMSTVKHWNISIRPLVTLTNVAVSQMPSDEFLQKLALTGPPLWIIAASVDVKSLRAAFANYDFPVRIPDHKMIFSSVLGEPILVRSSNPGERSYFWNQIMLWKLEQLAKVGNISKWKELLNKFMEDCKIVEENPNLRSLFVYDTIRIEIINWCHEFCRSDNLNEFEKKAVSIQGLLNSMMKMALQTNNIVFQRFGMEMAHYLMNSRRWKFGNERLKGQSLFKTPYTDLTVIFDVYLSKLYDEQRSDEANKVLKEVFWKVISPTFDEIRTGVGTRTALLSKNDFLDFLQGIKDADVLNVFLGMVAFLYNYALNATTTETICENAMVDDPFQQMHNIGENLIQTSDQQIFVDNLDLWQTMRSKQHDEEYRNRPLDMAFIKRVLRILCKQTQIASPVNATWLRIRADYAFVCERYEEAVQLYLEMLMALQCGLIGIVLDGECDKMVQKLDSDLVYSKLSVAFYHLRMPTLAAIIGQMRADIGPHLELVESLLRNTPLTVDAGPAYFPLVADIHLMEKMAAAYEKFELPLYQQALLKLMPTRAINVNNLPVILERENVRRRQRFMEIVYKQFLANNAFIKPEMGELTKQKYR